MSDELFCGDDLVEISLYYKIQKNKSGVTNVQILDEEDYNKMTPPEKQTVKVMKTKWTQQTWEAANDLLKRSMVYNHQKEIYEIDWTEFRRSKLKACLVDWDAKDKAGEPMPCNEFTINKLHANVAIALIEKYDKLTAVDATEQEKN